MPGGFPDQAELDRAHAIDEGSGAANPIGDERLHGTAGRREGMRDTRDVAGHLDVVHEPQRHDVEADFWVGDLGERAPQRVQSLIGFAH